MIPAGIVLLVLIIGTIIFKAVTSGESEEVTAGIAYIQDLEKGDIDEVEAVLALQRKQRLEAEREEKMRQVADGEVDAAYGFLAGGLEGHMQVFDFKHGRHLPAPR